MNKILPFLIGIFLSINLLGQSDLIISEYVEGWSTNKAIEVFNPTSSAINLSGYQLVRYANGEDVPPAEDDWTVTLPDVELEPYKSFVCVLDKRNPEGTGQEAPVWEQLADRADAFLCPNYGISNTLYHNGNDAIALEKTDGTLVDLFGRWGAPAPAAAEIPGSDRTADCWTDTAPYFTGEGIGVTADHTLYRKAAIVDGVVANPAMFNPLEQWDSLSANTFDHLGWHQSSVSPANETPEFEKASYDFTISKNATEGATLGSIKASDTEGDDLNYFILSGNFVYNDEDQRKTPFAMDKTSGAITLIDPSALQESPWDTIYMQVSVNDGFSESSAIAVNAVLRNWPVGKSDALVADFSIFPNPVKNGMLQLKSAKQMKSLKVMHLSGQLAKRENVAGYRTVINTDALSKGMYLLEVTYHDQSKASKRFVKE